MFILSIFNCKGEQSVYGGEGRGGRRGWYKGQFDPYSKYFQDIIKNISLLLLIRVTGQYLAGRIIQQLQTDVWTCNGEVLSRQSLGRTCVLHWLNNNDT